MGFGGLLRSLRCRVPFRGYRVHWILLGLTCLEGVIDEISERGTRGMVTVWILLVGVVVAAVTFVVLGRRVGRSPRVLANVRKRNAALRGNASEGRRYYDRHVQRVESGRRVLLIDKPGALRYCDSVSIEMAREK